MNQYQFKQLFGIIFGVLFVYLILGVYFKNEIGGWFAAIWYVVGLMGMGWFIYMKINRERHRPRTTKVVKAEIIRR